jgi:Na+/phosphate symporter
MFMIKLIVLIHSICRVAIFYPLSAQLTLFCNIMLNPSSLAASSDLNILCDAFQSIREQVHDSWKISDTHLSHLTRVEEFAEEVMRLAQTVVFQSQHQAAAQVS